MIYPNLFFLSLYFTISRAVDPLVDLGYSKYLGTALPNGVSQWLGIRFAAPPLGDLRFRAPADPPINTTVQVADEQGPICIPTGSPFPVEGTSEDCLFLDVYAPSNATSSSRLPVMFFIQGGAFNADSDADYNATELIIAGEMDMVVITFNYRVGPYGFLASREVVENGDTNVGLLDQRKALEWVQSYIAQFGGNPDHVVLSGDSAGAVSIILHLTAYGGEPTNLFHATIAESQAIGMFLTVDQSQYQYTALIDRVGCQNENDTLACLRALDIETFQNANIEVPYAGHSVIPVYMYWPVVDGKFIPDFIHRMFQEGRFIKNLPTVFGDVTNEGTMFTPTNISTADEMTQFMFDNYPFLTTEMAKEIQTLYPEGEQFANHSAFFSAAALVYGESSFTCPGIFLSSTINQLGNTEKNWNYHYNVTDPAQVAEGLGVPHVSELFAIWGPNNLDSKPPPASYFTTNAAIIPVVQGYWTSFIRTMDPNALRAAGTPAWEPFGENQQRLLFMTNATRMETVPEDQKERCDYLTSIADQLQQ